MTRELAPCGTWAAYKRHLRRPEETCPACRAKAAEITRERRAAKAAEQAPPEPTTGGTA